MLAWGVALLLVLNLVRPLWPRQTAQERWVWLAGTIACVLLIPLLKRHSLTSCPWDMAEFGGVARYVSHWHIGIVDGGPGRCFPSGHASSAFAFLSGWFALRRAYPRAARAWAAGRDRHRHAVRLGADGARRPLREPHDVDGLDLLGGLRAGRARAAGAEGGL